MTKSNNNKKSVIKKIIKNESRPSDALLNSLSDKYHDAVCALDYSTPFQLLIATMLSAQCTDERVNKVTPLLFLEYPTPDKMAIAKINRIEEIIFSTGFYRNKAKNIISCSQILVEKFNSDIPKDIEKLIHLPGVGRKTANVVLGNAFKISSGIVVDTHVMRLSRRFGWVRTKNAEIAERELLQIVPKKYWISFSHWMISHGRNTCTARSPKCQQCFLKVLCPQILK